MVRWGGVLSLGMLVGLVLGGWPTRAVSADDTKNQEDHVGVFYSLTGLKSAAYDSKTKRIFALASERLLIIDAVESKVIKLFDFGNTTGTMSVSPDFDHVAVSSARGRYVYWVDTKKLTYEKITFKGKDTEKGFDGIAVGKSDRFLTVPKATDESKNPLRLYQPSNKMFKDLIPVDASAKLALSPDQRYGLVTTPSAINGASFCIFDFLRRKMSKEQTIHLKRPMSHDDDVCLSSGAKYVARFGKHGLSVYTARGKDVFSVLGDEVSAAVFDPKRPLIYFTKLESEVVEILDLTKKKVTEVAMLNHPKFRFVREINSRVPRSPVLSKTHGGTRKTRLLWLGNQSRYLMTIHGYGILIVDLENPKKTDL